MCRQPFQAQTLAPLSPYTYHLRFLNPWFPISLFAWLAVNADASFYALTYERRLTIMQTLEFEVVHRICGGIGVHKKSLIAAV